jgi:DNA modification methylase
MDKWKSECARVELHLGDCLAVLRSMKDNALDSIVTDPPYGLSFMGKKWDYDVPSQEIWAECLRVLKPGGHLLAFAGTRTQHRMAVRIEDAGFEIRDMIAWVYGCYSEDTECLTDSGWKNYKDIKTGVDKILQWNHELDEFTWFTPEDVLVYDAPESMVHFQNRHTDQLLTSNHRVYLKYRTNSRYGYGKGFNVVEAGSVKKSWHKVFPLAANLSAGVSEPRAYMIGWWLTDAWRHKNGKAVMFSQSKPNTLIKLRDSLEDENCNYSEYVKVLKNPNHKDEHSFYVTGDLADFMLESYGDRKLTWKVLGFNFKSREALLEGLLDGDGSRPAGQSAETFWSMKPEYLDIVSAICSSLGIRNHIDYKKGCVYLNRKCGTTEFQNKHTVESVNYSGKKVWCLKTETGAFLVRRNGRPFISGNSGFPKSHNVSKAIDKAAGAEREVVTTRKAAVGFDTEKQGGGGWAAGEVSVTAPATDAAREWQGWGTALKPALEPITVARKPLTGTVAENVLEHGTGGLNIDGCRVGTETIKHSQDRQSFQKWKELDGRKPKEVENPLPTFHTGRWPANLIHDGSNEVTGLFPVTHGAGTFRRGKKQADGFLSELPVETAQKPAIDRGRSAARFFYCAKASKRDRDEGCEGMEERESFKANKGMVNEDGEDKWHSTTSRNHHPTVKPTDLMRYLCRLVTSPGGTVLDPFMGSGSTGKAAVLEGFCFIGIEREAEYLQVAKARIVNNLV